MIDHNNQITYFRTLAFLILYQIFLKLSIICFSKLLFCLSYFPFKLGFKKKKLKKNDYLGMGIHPCFS